MIQHIDNVLNISYDCIVIDIDSDLNAYNEKFHN